MAQGITNDTPFQKDVQSAIGGIKKVANSTADMAAEALAKIGAGMAVESAQPGANVGWYYTGKEQPLPAMVMGVENLPQPAKT